MKHAVLDTNFVLSCIRKKIDFFEKIPLMGMKIIIPIQVIDEIRKISRMGKGKFKDDAKLALTLMEKNRFNRIDLHTRNVDNGLISLAKKNENYVIGTLDTEIKNRTQSSVLVIRGEKRLEVI